MHALEKLTELERLSTMTATTTTFAMPMKSLAVRIAMLAIIILKRQTLDHAFLQMVFVMHALEPPTELERLSTMTATTTTFAMPMKSLAVRIAMLAITILKRQTPDHAFLQRVFVKHALEKTTELERLSTTTATTTIFAMPMKSLAVRIALRVTMTY
jgi:hypothetical protein